MKKMLKSMLVVFCCACILMSFSAVASAEQRVTIYSPAGDVINVPESEVSVYAQWGWSRNINDVRTLIYSTSGSAYVYNNQVAEYLSLGWSLTPLKIDYVTTLPTTLLSSKSYGTSAIDIHAFDIYEFEYMPQYKEIRVYYDFEYDESGSMTLYFDCYDSNGNKVKSIYFNKYAEYIDVPDSTSHFILRPDDSYGTVSGEFIYRRQVDMYAPDGRTITVFDMQVPIYESVGWYSAVKMYSLDGRVIQLPPNQVELYKSVGWYTYEGFCYQAMKSCYDSYMYSRDYNGAIECVEEYEGVFEGTEYEYSARLLKERAMDAWRNSTRCPLGYIYSETGSYYGTPTVDIAFRNTSYKDIIAFKLVFTCYDVFGDVEDTWYDWYYVDDADLASGESMVYTWDLDGASSVYRIGKLKITEVVYSDGTKW